MAHEQQRNRELLQLTTAAVERLHGRSVDELTPSQSWRFVYKLMIPRHTGEDQAKHRLQRGLCKAEACCLRERSTTWLKKKGQRL